MDVKEQEQARADFKIALTGFAIAVVVLAVLLGFASWLAMVTH
jgi:nucleoside permease NupC